MSRRNMSGAYSYLAWLNETQIESFQEAQGQLMADLSTTGLSV